MPVMGRRGRTGRGAFMRPRLLKRERRAARGLECVNKYETSYQQPIPLRRVTGHSHDLDNLSVFALF